MEQETSKVKQMELRTTRTELKKTTRVKQETNIVVHAERRWSRRSTRQSRRSSQAEQMGLKTTTVVLKTTMPATCTDLSCGSIKLTVTLLHSGTDLVIKEMHGERLLELGTYGPSVAAMT